MKIVVSILISFFFLVSQELPTVREHYIQASKSKENTEQFFVFMQGKNKNTPVLLAYEGASVALKSRYAATLKSKKEQFIAGVKAVENALKSEPNNAEIRLIRLSIQENTPKMLKYKANIQEDKKFIVESFSQQTASLKEYIRKYTKQSKVFLEADKQIILK